MGMTAIAKRKTFDQALATRLGARIKSRRIALGLSQDAIARMTNMTDSTIWHIEQGRNLPIASTIIQLSVALGMSPNEILGWESS
jgi:transcriptional regulator with XRE-family HTH domain